MPTESAKTVLEEPFSRPRDDDRWIATLAGRQHGVVSRSQLMESGWSDGAIRKRVRAGRLHRLHAGVYLVGHKLPADERMVKEGIPVTRVPRTIFDLAATEPVDVVESLLREAEHLRLWDKLSLPHLLERYPGRRGVRKVRAALERLEEEPEGRKRSPLEERFAPFLRLHLLPLPRFNDWICLNGKNYQVDCHWPDLRQIASDLRALLLS